MEYARQCWPIPTATEETKDMTSGSSITGRYLTIALAVFALIVVPLGAYVAGYLFLSNSFPSGNGVLVRTYRSHWEVTIFTPAARAESYLTGAKVTVTRPVSFDELVDLI